MKLFGGFKLGITNEEMKEGERMKESKKEKQLEFNLKGVSNEKELKAYNKKGMKEISKDSLKKLKYILSKVSYNNEDIRNIISLSKWIEDKDIV